LELKQGTGIVLAELLGFFGADFNRGLSSQVSTHVPSVSFYRVLIGTLRHIVLKADGPGKGDGQEDQDPLEH
jgi:hypothetical protein